MYCRMQIAERQREEGGEGVLVQAAKERAECRLQIADGRSPMRSDVAGLSFPPK